VELDEANEFGDAADDDDDDDGGGAAAVVGGDGPAAGGGGAEKSLLFGQNDAEEPTPADLLRSLLELELRLDGIQRSIVATQTERAGIGAPPRARGGAFCFECVMKIVFLTKAIEFSVYASRNTTTRFGGAS
jgi:hypothetical protein